MKTEGETSADELIRRRAIQASLPFAIVEQFSLPCAYERSVKFSSRELLANRYVLGIPAAAINVARLEDICQRLALPTERLAEIVPLLEEANVVFLGCEDNGCDVIFKIYVELYERRRAELLANPKISVPLLTHFGIKWRSGTSDKGQIAKYLWHPNLSPQDALQSIGTIYRDIPSTSHACTQQIIQRALARSSQCIYLEVEEANSLRRSFDMNIYAADMRVDQVTDLLQQAALSYDLSQHEFDRLIALIGSRKLGHVSGGVDRRGQDFYTIYYEFDSAV